MPSARRLTDLDETPVMINVEGVGADQIVLWEFVLSGRRAIELDQMLIWDHDLRFNTLMECFE